jgi:hypothetical protein
MSATPEPPAWSRPESGPGWGAGTVTRLGTPAPPAAPPTEATEALPGGAAPVGPSGPPPATGRRQLWWFGGAAALLAVAGLVVVLVITLTGDRPPFWDRPPAASDVRPPLARLCPPPSGAPPAAPPAPGPVTGPRTVDNEAGISYRAYGEPWQPWQMEWRAGTLEVPYRVGQHIVTEVYAGGTYHASILSAAVPAADNDALALNLECVGRQVAADVRAEYYPQPNTMDLMRDERTVLGGLPAWVTKFRLHFSEPGLRATDELVAVALLDVGRPQAAVLYVSIPGTHRQLDWVVDDVLRSVRPG